MVPSFVISVDPVRSYVRVVLCGFFTASDVALFVAARDREHRKLRCSSNQHLTLVDVTGMKIQSQESVERFASMLANSSMWARRLVFVVDTSLARMQAKRAISGREVAFFRTISEAEAWLFRPVEESPAGCHT